MLISNGFKISGITNAFIAAVAMASIASPAFAQSRHHRDATSPDHQIIRQYKEPAQSGRNGFDMASDRSFQLDPNSPALTGGGSLGYNRKLLEYRDSPNA